MPAATSASQRERAGWLGLMVLLFILLVSLIPALSMGSVSIPLSDWPGIFWPGNSSASKPSESSGDDNATSSKSDHRAGANESVRNWRLIVLRDLRLPRVLLAVLIGGSLAVSGLVMQAIFRNPLADPGLLGVSSGASLGAVIAIYSKLAFLSALVVPMSAFGVALVCAGLVYGLGVSRGRIHLTTLILAGVAIGGMAASITSFILSLSLKTWDVGREIVFWMMGGLDGKTWNDLLLASPILMGGTLLIWLLSRDLDILAIGEDTALSVGLDVHRARIRLLLLATLLAATATAVAGTIVFVGLMTPHLLRWWFGFRHKFMVPASFLAGAALLVISDLGARVLLFPDEIRLGVVTSMLGGPFFLGQLWFRRQRNESLL